VAFIQCEKFLRLAEELTLCSMKLAHFQTFRMITEIFIVTAVMMLLYCRMDHPAVLTTDHTCKFHLWLLDGSKFAESDKFCAGRQQQRVFQFKLSGNSISDLYKV